MIRAILSWLRGPLCDAYRCNRAAKWESTRAPSWARGFRWCGDHAHGLNVTPLRKGGERDG